jgi:hypothetical protein
MDDFSKIDEYLFRVHSNLQRSGLHVTAVFGTPTSPSWAYTIGLLEHGHPELVTIGLSPQSAHGFLAHAFDEAIDGIPLELGRDRHRTWDGSDTDLHVSFVEVPEILWQRPSSLVGTLHAYYGSRGGYPCTPRVCQLVWPDMDGRLPWEPGFDESLRRYQPLLDQEPWLPPVDDDGECCPCCACWEEP